MGESFFATAAVRLEEVGCRQSPPQSMWRFAQAYIREAVWDIGVEVGIGSCPTRRQEKTMNQYERESILSRSCGYKRNEVCTNSPVTLMNMSELPDCIPSRNSSLLSSRVK